MFPATPYDTKGMLNGSNPVLFLESQRIYDIGEQFRPDVPEGCYEIPLGEPNIKKEGKD